MTIRTLLAMCVALVAGIGLAEQPAKKIIEWGWDEPDTNFIRENLETMEQHPFDGLVFHVTRQGPCHLVQKMAPKKIAAVIEELMLRQP